MGSSHNHFIFSVVSQEFLTLRSVKGGINGWFMPLVMRQCRGEVGCRHPSSALQCSCSSLGQGRAKMAQMVEVTGVTWLEVKQPSLHLLRARWQLYIFIFPFFPVENIVPILLFLLICFLQISLVFHHNQYKLFIAKLMIIQCKHGDTG